MPASNPATPLKHGQKRTFSERLNGPLFWIILSGFVAASALVFYFVFWTTWRTTIEGQGDLSTAAVDSAIVDAEQQLVAYKQHEAQLQGLPQSDLDRMTIALPNGPAYPELLVQLEALAKESGMLDASFDASAVSSSSSAARAPNGPEGMSSGPLPQTIAGSFGFTVNSYDDMKRIIEILQKNLRLLDLTRLTYDPLTQKVNVGFITYYIK